jgi:hypothetical protein
VPGAVVSDGLGTAAQAAGVSVKYTPEPEARYPTQNEPGAAAVALLAWWSIVTPLLAILVIAIGLLALRAKRAPITLSATST